MWFDFALSIFVCCAFLYIPGWFFLRFAGRPNFQSLVCAPIISILGFCLIAMAEELCAIRCSWETVVLPILVLGVLLFAAKQLVLNPSPSFAKANTPTNASSSSTSKKSAEKQDFLWVSASVIFASVVTTWTFVATLDGPYSLFQENDLIAHVSSVRDFVETGHYYALGAGMYPQAWFTVVTVVIDALQAKMGIAINAVNFVLLAVVFPSSMCLFMRTIFEGNKSLANWSALFPAAFAAFPYGFMLFGPLYPNLSGYALLPIAMIFFVNAFAKKLAPRERMIYLALFCLGCASLALLHPNAIFVGIVLLTPYCVHLIWSFFSKEGHTRRVFGVSARWFFSLAFILFVLAVWTALFLSPVFSGVVAFVWEAYSPASTSILSILILSFTKASAPQLLLAALIICGVVYCVVRKRYFWVVASYLIAVIMLFFAISTEGFIKHFLTGFWYTDSFRIASMAAMAGMPLAAIGLNGVYRAVLRLFGKRLPASAHKIVAALLAVLFVAGNYVSAYPALDGSIKIAGFGQVREMLAEGNSLETNRQPYDKAEYDFVEKVKAVVPEGEVLVNIPYDGSAFAAGLNGIELLNAGWYGYEKQPVDSEKAIVRNHLSEAASNASVKQALEKLNLEYLLILDSENTTGQGMYAGPYDPKLWDGITSVTDDTPGFEVVLAEGDMRLYRIIA